MKDQINKICNSGAFKIELRLIAIDEDLKIRKDIEPFLLSRQFVLHHVKINIEYVSTLIKQTFSEFLYKILY
jgi:hypothetical protein